MSDGDPLARRATGRDERVLVLVPAGALYVGEDVVPVPAFYLDRDPVTVGDWRRYLAETGQTLPGTVTERDESAPMTGVRIDEAEAYAAWVGRRLPTAVEWQRAAIGRFGLDTQLGENNLGMRREGDIWEWTATPSPHGGRLVCGGAYRDGRHLIGGPLNLSWEDAAAADVGFRLAASPRAPELTRVSSQLADEDTDEDFVTAEDDISRGEPVAVPPPEPAREDDAAERARLLSAPAVPRPSIRVEDVVLLEPFAAGGHWPPHAALRCACVGTSLTPARLFPLPTLFDGLVDPRFVSVSVDEMAVCGLPQVERLVVAGVPEDHVGVMVFTAAPAIPLGQLQRVLIEQDGALPFEVGVEVARRYAGALGNTPLELDSLRARMRWARPDYEVWLTLDGDIDVLLTPIATARPRRLGRNLRWLSPEHVLGAGGLSTDPAWCVTSLLFELLCPRSALPRSGLAAPVLEVLEHTMRGPPPDLAALRPDAPPALVELVARGTSRRPEERWPRGADELARVLDDIAAELPPYDPRFMAGLLRAFLPDDVARESEFWEQASMMDLDDVPRVELTPVDTEGGFAEHGPEFLALFEEPIT